MSSDKQRAADEVLCYLNANCIRATYGALGGVIGVSPQSVGKYLGSIRPQASWVVRKKDGRPTGYSKQQEHHLLYRCEHVIDNCRELRKRLHASKGVAD